MGFTYQNNKTIKLPISEYHDSLKNFLDIRNKASLKNIKYLIIE